MPDITAFQKVLRDANVDGWLFFDFRRSNAIAHRVLGLSPHAFFTRRWMYYVPVEGEPTAIVSAVESHALSSLPGKQQVYRTWREYREFISAALAGARRVAMEYVPHNAIPYCSLVDGGTIELVQALGPEVVSSADFAQQFEAVLTEAQIDSHRRAGQALVESGNRIFDWIRARTLAGDELTEYSIQQELSGYMRAAGFAVPDDEAPLVAVNGNAGNPHYSPSAERHSPVRKGDVLLIDYSAPLAEPGAIVADYTWMAYIGERTPQRAADLFDIIRRARDTGVAMIREAFEAGRRIEGWTVDDAVRAVVAEAGYGEAFVHRTGHNIGERVHGNGAHLDNLETHDTRPLLPNTCVSVEPGIYLPAENIGLRTEINVLALPGGIEVTGWEQPEIKPLLA